MNRGKFKRRGPVYGRHMYACLVSPTGAHHWMLPTPDGSRVVPGTCKYCGKTSQRFRNGVEFPGDWHKHVDFAKAVYTATGAR